MIMLILKVKTSLSSAHVMFAHRSNEKEKTHEHIISKRVPEEDHGDSHWSGVGSPDSLAL
jgi:hypothetical protein